MGLVKKIASLLCAAAFTGLVYSASPVKSAASSSTIRATGANINILSSQQNVCISGAGNNVNISGSVGTIEVEGVGNNINGNPAGNGRWVPEGQSEVSGSLDVLEKRLFLTCDNINCEYSMIKEGQVNSVRFIPPELNSIEIIVNDTERRIIKKNGIIELEPDDKIRISSFKVNFPEIWTSYHRNFTNNVLNRGYLNDFTVNFKGYDSGSPVHEDRGPRISQNDLIEKYKNSDGTWSIEVLERDEPEIRIGEVFIRYKGPATPQNPRTAKIRIVPYIDNKITVSRGFRVFPIDIHSAENMEFYNSVLRAASDNLYSNFNIQLEWGEFQSYETEWDDNTTTAYDDFERKVPGGSNVNILFFRGEDHDNASGRAAIGGNSMIVDADTGSRCVTQTILHEMGHIFSLEYGNDHHLQQNGYIMSENHYCSISWSDESRRQIIYKLRTRELNRIITYE
ncbi:hypothetical protein KY308_02990 [Candidatus Woesearchaeota archaeon]|nr:hypothetical protein [Candidatus Woesearchaeota archaeon]